MMVSYYSEQEIEKAKSVEDKDLNELLQEVRSHEPRFYLEERKFTTKKSWFKKSTEKIYYQILFDTGNGHQVINFCHDHEGSSINSYVSKSYIYTFFSSWLDGFERGKKKALIAMNLKNEKE